MNSDALVEAALELVGFPVRPCGLNADWWARTWHLGPGNIPNTHPGEVYLNDLEESDDSRTWQIVRTSWEDDEDTENTVLVEATNLVDALTKAKEILRLG